MDVDGVVSLLSWAILLSALEISTKPFPFDEQFI
jgi:hypothetical protein